MLSIKLRPYILSIAGFLITLIDGSIGVFIANKVGGIVGTEYVGYVYGVANITLLLFIPFLGRWICKFKKTWIIFATSFVFLCSFILLFFEQTFAGTVLLSLVIYIVSLYVFFFVNDLFVEMYTQNKNTGTVRGRYLSLLNLGWVIAPIVTGYIIQSYGYTSLYTAYIIIIAIVFSLFFLFFCDDNKIEHCGIPFKSTFNILKTTPDVVKLLFLQFILWFFYAFDWSFLLIYFHQNLFLSWEYIGMIVSMYNIPYLLFDYVFGRLVDKVRTKEYLFLNIGLLIGVCGMFLSYFYVGTALLVWMGIVLLTRFGIALFELMINTRFYRLVDAKDVNQISMFSMFTVSGGLACSIVGAVLLHFATLHTFILFVALALAASLIITMRMRKTYTV